MSRLSSLQSSLNYIGNISSSNSNKNATLLIREISIINSTNVSLAASRADQLDAAVDALDARRSAADAAVRLVAAESGLLAARLASLRARLASIPPAADGGTADVAQLEDDVRRAVDDVTSRAWDSLVDQMRSSLAEYETSIESRKLRRDDLRARLARMARLLALFT